MNFTQMQRYEILKSIIKKEGGIEEILKMSLEILMKAERDEHILQTERLSHEH